MSEYSDKLDNALRESRARRLRDQWAESLHRACGLSVLDRFITLDATATLRKKFFDRVKSCHNSVQRSFIPKANIVSVSEVLDAANIARPDTEIILFSSVDAFLGGVRLPASAALDNASAVWKVVENDLCMATLDSSSGLCIEDSVYGEDEEYIPTGVYEVTAWGFFVP